MAPTRVAINGFGRIGRLVLRAAIESGRKDLEFVAINDLGSPEINAHLLMHDTVHGQLGYEVSVDQHQIRVNGFEMKALSEPLLNQLPWRELGVDIVMECTGRFNDKAEAATHLAAGAKRVLVSDRKSVV